MRRGFQKMPLVTRGFCAPPGGFSYPTSTKNEVLTLSQISGVQEDRRSDCHCQLIGHVLLKRR